MTENQLQELLKQKQELDQRTDLSPDEKDKLAKRLRREIRKLGGTVRVLKDANATYEPHSTGHRDHTELRIPTRSARYQKREFQSYKEELLTKLQDNGLVWKDPHDILDIPAAGYSFVFMYELEVEASVLIDRFKNQWSQQLPEWFAIVGDGAGEFLVIGPLPQGMVH